MLLNFIQFCCCEFSFRRHSDPSRAVEASSSTPAGKEAAEEEISAADKSLMDAEKKRGKDYAQQMTIIILLKDYRKTIKRFTKFHDF